MGARVPPGTPPGAGGCRTPASRTPARRPCPRRRTLRPSWPRWRRTARSRVLAILAQSPLPSASTSPPRMQAPLADPGGVLRTRHRAPSTAAVRPRATGGVSPRTAVRDSRWSTTLPLAGRPPAACLLAPSRGVRPVRGVHVACAPDRLARLGAGGTGALALTHGVTTTHGMRARSLPRSRASLGATSAWLGLKFCKVRNRQGLP